MPRTNLSMSISADGYVAGPDQSEENPLGVGGIAVHHWHIGPASDHPVNRQVMSEMLDGMGATIMGRNMFGPIRGEWADSDWKGWWGDTPPPSSNSSASCTPPAWPTSATPSPGD